MLAQIKPKLPSKGGFILFYAIASVLTAIVIIIAFGYGVTIGFLWSLLGLYILTSMIVAGEVIQCRAKIQGLEDRIQVLEQDCHLLKG